MSKSSQIPTNPVKNPIILRLSTVSDGAKKWARGSIISPADAIETPAKLELTYCCPQLKRKNGSAVLKIPSSIRPKPSLRLPSRSENPCDAQSIHVKAVAILILAATSQPGDIPLKASSIRKKALPQIILRAIRRTQLDAGTLPGSFTKDFGCSVNNFFLI